VGRMMGCQDVVALADVSGGGWIDVGHGQHEKRRTVKDRSDSKDLCSLHNKARRQLWKPSSLEESHPPWHTVVNTCIFMTSAFCYLFMCLVLCIFLRAVLPKAASFGPRISPS